MVSAISLMTSKLAITQSKVAFQPEVALSLQEALEPFAQRIISAQFAEILSRINAVMLLLLAAKYQRKKPAY